MRSIFITLGAMVLAGPATAQSWEEYNDSTMRSRLPFRPNH
jgi:hypothetical protein